MRTPCRILASAPILISGCALFTDEPSPPDRKNVTVLLLIDKSGSMVGTPIRLAKEAAVASAAELTAGDYFGVIAFDGEPFHGNSPRPALVLTPAERKEKILDRISRIAAGGGTDSYKALRSAHRMFQSASSRTSVRHVILLSDGLTDIADFNTLVSRMTEDGITISTVCIAAGAEFDDKLMKSIAGKGNGRSWITSDLNEIPGIFERETRLVTGQASASAINSN